ncbi:aminotransferase class I/II-fold pyridoxal phosphate-dependent enzyme [Rhodobacterales bacterium HKCCE2091]|nr:aminotransferase class I/II-fold pyridoxal phosphate-dependent enzyme [Rhodobacterales bacterium HKCCE2091]
MIGSERIRGLRGSGDGWSLYRRARAMAEAGEDVAELTIGEHDVRTDPVILDAMHDAAKAGATGYAPVPGMTPLRAAIAERVEASTGVATAPDNVLVTPGGQAGLFTAHMALLDPGDVALHIDPFYATYPGTIRAAGGVPRAVEARAADGFQPREDDLRAAAEGARSLLVNSPNNPTGAVYTRETLEGIVRVCRDTGLSLISDEVYDTQVWQGTHLSPRALPGMRDAVLVVGSLSKSHAMTGSRLGWVIGPPEIVARMIELAEVTTFGVPGFVQSAGLHALGLGPEFEARIAAPFRRRRDLVMTMLDRQQVLTAVPAAGAMYVMLDVSGTGMDGAGFAEALLDAERIAVMPGASFGAAARSHVRVALSLPDDRFSDAIGRLVSFAGRQANVRAAE